MYLTQTELETRYILYLFKIIDGRLGSGAKDPRSRAAYGLVCREIGLAAAHNKALRLSCCLKRSEFSSMTRLKT